MRLFSTFSSSSATSSRHILFRPHASDEGLSKNRVWSILLFSCWLRCALLTIAELMTFAEGGRQWFVSQPNHLRSSTVTMNLWISSPIDKTAVRRWTSMLNFFLLFLILTLKLCASASVEKLFFNFTALVMKNFNQCHRQKKTDVS